MKHTPSFHFPIFLYIVALLFVTCSRQDRVAKPMPESVQAYVYAYTQGVVSRQAEIRIQFAAIVADEEKIGQEPEKSVARLSPAAEGTWTWADRQTLVFTPNPLLEAGTAYIVKVDLSTLFDNLPADAEQFEFGFRTRDPYISLAIESIETPDYKERNKQVITGKLQTSDYVNADQVAGLLEASQDGRQLPITWSPANNGTAHYFTIGAVERGSEVGEVQLEWSGKAIGAEQDGEETIEIPALGDFKVTRVTQVSGSDPHVLVQFSDLLQEQQDLSGLIKVTNTTNDFRFVIKGHQVMVYPRTTLSGKQRVTVNTGIKDIGGAPLPQTSYWDIEFITAEPQVRMVGKGVVLPATTGLLFPFEAIGLTAVEVEVFQIYHSNILQFLQTNTLDGNGELYRVGEVIHREEVLLGELDPTADHNQWRRYALDLENFIEADPQSIYQVRIGFRKRHSTFSCSDDRTFQFRTDGYYQSDNMMESWYGIDGYYEGYEWSHRNDPCFPAYYNANRFVQCNVLASNLGIISKGTDRNTYHFVVADLRTTEAVAGVNIKLYNFLQQEIGSVTTDAEGQATVQLEEEPFVAVAEGNGEQGYLRMQDGEALALTRFDIGGIAPQEGLKGYLYGERGVWRPGDSVFLNFVLEDQEGQLPPDYPVAFELRDPQGQLRVNRTGVAPEGRIYPLHFMTSIDDPTGNWRAKVTAGNASFYQRIRIETVKPNRIKIELNFEEDVLFASEGETANGEMTANWLHGAPASNLTAEVDASFNSDFDPFDTYKDYTFTNRWEDLRNFSMSAFNGELDDNGTTDIQLALPASRLAPGPLSVSLRSRVFERGGDFSTDNQQLKFHPFANYVGVRLPKNNYGYQRLPINQEATVNFVTLTDRGGEAADRQLKVELFRVDWRWWWDRGYDSQSQYNRQELLNPLAEAEIRSDGRGHASWEVKVEQWGRYLVRVCDTASGHCSGDYVYAGSPRRSSDSQAEEAAMLMFQADKEVYQKGEEVEITFPAGENGRALVSLESGSGIWKTEWIDVQAGDNTYQFTAEAEMAPTVYVHLTVLQPHGQTDNDLPIRLYGVIPIDVEDASTKLAPTIAMQDELEPEQRFTVEVAEEEGRPMTYTLAVVDEGLLSLTRFQTPNPWDGFYAREALGVKTWDMYDQVLGAYGGQLEQVLSIGGDGGAIGKPDADRANRFDPVVMHLGPFELDRRGKASHELVMPNYVGAVRVMVVAAGDKAYGAAEKNVPVRKPLMILPTLPRVLGVGETFELPVNVFAMTNEVKNVSIRLEEISGLAQVQESRRQLNFQRPGDDIAFFPVRVGEQVGVAKFTIVAEGNGQRATQEIEIDVRNPNPVQTLVERFVLEPGEEQSLPLEPLGVAGTRETFLEMTNLPPIDLQRRLSYLLRYPYGCLEQTLSSGFPQLHLAKFIELSSEQEERTQRNVQATIERLRRFQLTSGGFGYWPGANQPNQWATNYAGHFLVEAKAAGYSIPAGMLENWTRFQRRAARQWDPQLPSLGFVRSENYQLNQAYRLYTLAIAQSAEIGAMNQLREQGDLSNIASWRLAAAYALAGQVDIGKQLVRQVPTTITDYRELSYTYGSGIRDRAMVLEALVVLDDETSIDRVAQLLSDNMSGSRWLSTQDIAFSLLAFSKYIGENDELNSEYTFSFQQAGQSAIDAGADHPFMQIRMRDERGSVRVQNTSNQTLFGSIIRKGQPLPEQEAATASMININVQYLDQAGNAIDVAGLPQGTDFVAEVRVTHTNELTYPFEELALRQIFPSGWEITNSRFEGLQGEPESPIEYRDYRDDRVFTFFDLPPNNTHVYRVYLTAAYQGRFYLPAFVCEAMYDDKIFANSEGRWVEVGKPTTF